MGLLLRACQVGAAAPSCLMFTSLQTYSNKKDVGIRTGLGRLKPTLAFLNHRGVNGPRTRRVVPAAESLPSQAYDTLTDAVCCVDNFLEPDGSWLGSLHPFCRVDPEAVDTLLAALRPRLAAEGEKLTTSGRNMRELVVLRTGRAAVTVCQQGTKGARTEVGPGAVFGWRQLLMSTPCDQSIEVLEPSIIWAMPAADFSAVAARHPAMARELTEELTEELEAANALVEDERQRQRALQPYLASSPKAGILGTSKYAARLRKEISKAARDAHRGPVLIYGEPGLEKDNVAALIHFSSPDHANPMVVLDCTRLDPGGADLFGRGSKRGILFWLRDGTLLLKDTHLAPEKLLPRLKELLTSKQPPIGTCADPVRAGLEQAGQGRRPRVFMLAEARTPLVDALEPLCTTIQVAPLRIRLADIPPLADSVLKDVARHRGQPPQRLTQEALVRLESYKFPNNISQLRAIVERATVQAGEGNLQIGEDVFWFASQAQDRFRVNLLNSFPPLRSFLRSSMWPADINLNFTAPVFAVYVALLFILPQDRAHNFGLNLFWDWWWPGIFLLYPFLGRVWCSVCPFMIYGQLVQRWRVAKGAVLRKWPRQQLDVWGPWFLYVLFFGILVWEEVWELNNTAYLSAWLLIIITAGAIICSAFFERRMWCRYLCPIGGMNGMFAKLSMIEVRGREGVCSATCNTYHCFKGGPAEEEGLATAGCPLHSHPAQLTDNRNCTLCMDCLKACPHRSVEVRLRPPGIDLWTTHKPSVPELWLMFMLLGAVYEHRLPQLIGQLGMDPALLADKLPHMLLTALLLLAPGALCWGADATARTLPRLLGPSPSPSPSPKPFVWLAYGYLPLVWAATLAHYLDLGLTEAGRILPVTAASVGFDAWGDTLPVLTTSPSVVSFLQGSTLFAGASLSLLLTRKLAEAPWKTAVPQCAAILLATAELWALIV